MKLNFMIICDNALFDSVRGRINIIQAFDIIKTPGFPAIHARMCIVTKWEFEKGDDKQKAYKQKLVITEKKSGKEIAKTKSDKVIAESEKVKSFRCISTFKDLEFNQEGEYIVKAYMDGKESKEVISFELKKEKNAK